ncbi:protein NUCLEOLAR COMPLEX ASSOCIATED 4-like isoform X2 [Musa acuminata AAA Group]|uniref:protein NUCLEOLAR COMPLEX ASSOCIATED 4-like isoform X2 n=1 Tax=Musa acuminata AAA Group TaxID=214697 RepID=UPI0031D48069
MASPAKKRKQPQGNEERRKRRSGGTLALDDLKALGNQLLSSRAHINNLPVLLSFLSPSSPVALALESLISIQSFFVPLFPEIPSSLSVPNKRSEDPTDDGKEKDVELVFKDWLRERFGEFLNGLIEITVSEQSVDALRDVALDAIMDFVKLGKDGRFHSAIYHRFLHRIVRATSAVDPLLDLLGPKYFKYIDVRYFTYTSMDKIIKSFESKIGKATLHSDEDSSKLSSMEFPVRIMYNILSRCPPSEAEKEQSSEMWSQLGISSKVGKLSSNDPVSEAEPENTRKVDTDVSSSSHITKKIKLKFAKAWISFLKLPLPVDVYKEVLASIHQTIIPYLANPSILCDFLTRSYDIGGVVSVMALNGLFILMTQHGLEYPKFYEKLYALLTPAIFMAKHRAGFFQLLDTCLKSSYLPAYLAATFAKKLSRLALAVPPSGALIIIAVIHNLLRRHPAINFLVHQPIGDENDRGTSVEDNRSGEDARESDNGNINLSTKLGTDPFNIQECDPAKSNAMRSSLWEIETLRHHYTPAVSRFVASLENDLTVRAKTSEVTVADFSSGSYATVFREEVRRRIKQVPIAFYKVIPSSLFDNSEFPGWTFGNQQNDKQELNARQNEVTV